MQIKCYVDFTEALLASGFSLGGGNSEGIYSVVTWNWNQEPPYATPVRWHTGDPETDPWEWRTRVLSERNDIAYAKCFFKKSGYITQEFYPYFLTMRRGGYEFDEEYRYGGVSHYAKRIYDVIKESGTTPYHELKRLGGFGREEKSKFDSALIELQMLMYITICGTCRRLNSKGLEYGWDTTVFCTTEQFWKDTGVFERASKISEDEAYVAIRERVLKLNPDADARRIGRFIHAN